MEMYLLNSAACLALFFAFYKLFLERQNMHTFKRFYLLGALILAFTIPFITFVEYVEVQPSIASLNTSDDMVKSAVEIQKVVNYPLIILGIVYGIGLLFFGLKFCKNLFRMVQKIQKNPRYRDKSIIHVLLNTPTTPHTFFNYIFLHKAKFEAREIPEEVMLHEQSHAREKHSLDILFIELLQVVFWFNPLIYFIKHSIKLNHEFLADRAVLSKGVETANYQNILLAYSSNANSPSMGNSINYSSFKKRFTVMKTQTSKRGIWLRTLLLLPLLAVLIYGFSSTEQVVKISEGNNEKIQLESSLSKNELTQATPEQLVTYNEMASYWNQYFLENPQDKNMPLTELKKLEAIYRTMSADQRKNAEPFPECELKEKTTEKIKYAKEYLAGAERNNKKAFVLTVDKNEINLNAKPSSLKTIKEDLDALTHDWEETDYTEAYPSILVSSTSEAFIEKLNEEFRKTHYSKANGGLNIISSLDLKSGDRVKATPEQIAEYNKLARKYNSMDKNNMRINGKELTRMYYIYGIMTPEQKKNAEPYPDIPPPPPAPKAPKPIKVKKGVNDGDKNIPPPPPPPPAPKINIKTENVSLQAGPIKIDNKDLYYHTLNNVTTYYDPYGNVVNDLGELITPPEPPKPPQDPLIDLSEMIKAGAQFYFNDKKISTKRAKELVDQIDTIERVQVINNKRDKPEVRFWGKE